MMSLRLKYRTQETLVYIIQAYIHTYKHDLLNVSACIHMSAATCTRGTVYYSSSNKHYAYLDNYAQTYHGRLHYYTLSTKLILHADIYHYTIVHTGATNQRTAAHSRYQG